MNKILSACILVILSQAAAAQTSQYSRDYQIENGIEKHYQDSNVSQSTQMDVQNSNHDNADVGVEDPIAAQVAETSVVLQENPFPHPHHAFDTSLTQWGKQALDHTQDPTIQSKIRHTDQELVKQLNTANQDGKPYLIWVNIPSYLLRVYDTQSQEVLLESRVIVGASGSRTPVFNTDIVNIKFNPDWTPPPSLVRKGRRYTASGPNNPLGQARFSANNNMNIYLHDTNDHSMYDRDNRALSAGCVRVEQWHQLSQILTGWDPTAVDDITKDNKIRFIDVPDSLVWISYERIDFDDNGVLTLHPDVYRRQPLNDVHWDQ